jgi:hypothetical protein
MQPIDLYETLFDALTAWETDAADEYANTADPEAAHREHRAQDAISALEPLFPPCQVCGDCTLITGICDYCQIIQDREQES